MDANKIQYCIDRLEDIKDLVSDKDIDKEIRCHMAAAKCLSTLVILESWLEDKAPTAQ